MAISENFADLIILSFRSACALNAFYFVIVFSFILTKKM